MLDVHAHVVPILPVEMGLHQAQARPENDRVMATFALVNSFTRANRTPRPLRGIYDGTTLLFMTQWDGGGAASNPEVMRSIDRGVTISHNSVGAGGSSLTHGLVKVGLDFWMMEAITPSVRRSTDGITWVQDASLPQPGQCSPFVRDGSSLTYADSDNVAASAIKRRTSPGTWVSLGSVGVAPQRFTVPVPGTSDVLMIHNAEANLLRITLEALTVVADIAAATPPQTAGPTIGAITASLFYASKTDAINSRIRRSIDGGSSYADTNIPAPFSGQCHGCQFVRFNNKTYAIIAQGGGGTTGGRPAALASIGDADATWAIESNVVDPGVGWQMIQAATRATLIGLDAFLLWQNGSSFQVYALGIGTGGSKQKRLRHP
jgi:hypothetical protein